MELTGFAPGLRPPIVTHEENARDPRAETCEEDTTGIPQSPVAASDGTSALGKWDVAKKDPAGQFA